MVIRMKTTMDLPDGVMRELRERAQAEQVPMRDIVLEALRRELDRRSEPTARIDFSFPVSSAGGGLAADVDSTRLADYAYDLS